MFSYNLIYSCLLQYVFNSVQLTNSLPATRKEHNHIVTAMTSVLLALLGIVSVPEEFPTTKEGCGRKFLNRIVCVCVCVREKNGCLFLCVRSNHFASHYNISINISKSLCAWNEDQRVNIPVFIWLNMKKFHYLLILTEGSFPSSDLQQESSIFFCGRLGTCEM